MKDYGIKYLDLEFTVRGNYEEEEPHMYEFSGNAESFEIYEIHYRHCRRLRCKRIRRKSNKRIL
jgi:hypothetical protein